MKKLGEHGIPPIGSEAVVDAIGVATQVIKTAEQTHGELSLQTASRVLGLGSIHRSNENYEQAEPQFERHVDIVSKLLGPESPEALNGLDLLLNTQCVLGKDPRLDSRFDSVFLAKTTIVVTDGMGNRIDPMIEALYDLATICRDHGGTTYLRAGLVCALMALNHYVSCYVTGHGMKIRTIPRLRKIILSFGIERHTYAWVLRRAQYTKADFPKLLSLIVSQKKLQRRVKIESDLARILG